MSKFIVTTCTSINEFETLNDALKYFKSLPPKVHKTLLAIDLKDRYKDGDKNEKDS